MARPAANREGEYTVKDVAGIIAYDKSPEGIAKVARQVRHWTNNDLLTPLGPKQTGTGINRLYDAHGVRKASIILELTRYGINVFLLDMIDEWLDNVSGMDEWGDAINGGEDFYLQFAWDAADEPGSFWLPGMERGMIIRTEMLHKTGMSTASMVLVNLTVLFRRIAV